MEKKYRHGGCDVCAHQGFCPIQGEPWNLVTDCDEFEHDGYSVMDEDYEDFLRANNLWFHEDKQTS